MGIDSMEPGVVLVAIEAVVNVIDTDIKILNPIKKPIVLIGYFLKHFKKS